MVATSAPFGFMPNYHPSGNIRPTALPGGISAAYGSNIFKGQPVLMDTAGVLQPVTSGSVDFLGVFAGVEYVATATNRYTYSNHWTAGTPFVAGTLTAYYWDDPAIVYVAQADGSLAQSSILDEANISNFADGNTLIGLSQCTLSSTLVGAGSQGQWRIRDIALVPNNLWGDAYTVVQVSIARHQMVSNKVAV